MANKRKVVVSDKKDYERYLKSERWKTRRRRYFKRNSKICFCCEIDKRIVLHHCNYARVGEEKDKDLVALCWSCHQKIHKMIRDKEAKLRNAHKTLKELNKLKKLI